MEMTINRRSRSPPTLTSRDARLTPPTHAMNPLSGSNRVPLSPRRTSSFLAPFAPHGYTPPFPVPTYLRHSSFHSRFHTTPNPNPTPSPTRPPPRDSLERDHPDHSNPDSDPDSEAIPLPTHWDERDKCALLELSSDGRVASFAGSAKYGDRDAAAVRADHPVPSETGVYYFEVEILNKGVSGYIGIGLSHRSVSLSRLPGWESLSYGYHADDGRAFCSQGTGEPFGPTFTTGDVVGCGIDWTDAGGERGKRERDGSKKGKDKGTKERGSGRVFYTKNGVFIGYAFSNLSGKLYPTIGLRTPNESVRVNFGQTAFRFDVESLLLDRKRTILSRINDTTALPPRYYLSPADAPTPAIPTLSLPSSSSSASERLGGARSERDRMHETLQSLIAGYLRHCGYDDSARAFERQVTRERTDRAEGIVVKARCPSTGPLRIDDDDDVGRDEGETKMETEGTRRGGHASSAELRSRILSLAMTDRTNDALELVREHYPAVLERATLDDDGLELAFKLECRVFVEAVLAYSKAETSSSSGTTPRLEKGKGKTTTATRLDDEDVDMSSSFVSTRSVASSSSSSSSSPISIDELLTLGRSLHANYSSRQSPSIQSELQATLGLLAYRDPFTDAAAGPARRIVEARDRDSVVERLNRAILKASNLPPHPTLELLFRHAVASVEYASELGSGGAALVNVHNHVLGGE